MIQIGAGLGACDKIHVVIWILTADGKDLGARETLPVEMDGLEVVGVVGAEFGDEFDGVGGDVEVLLAVYFE